jgi:hypothetical protein
MTDRAGADGEAVVVGAGCSSVGCCHVDGLLVGGLRTAVPFEDIVRALSLYCLGDWRSNSSSSGS